MKKKIILFLASTVIAVSLAGCKSGDYNEAIKLQEAGDYQAALELYENIEDYENYKDAAERGEAATHTTLNHGCLSRSRENL